MNKADVEDLLVDHLPHMQRIATVMLRRAPKCTVDDLVQDSCVRILEKYHLMKSDKNVRGWMNMVTRNKGIDLMKKFTEDQRRNKICDYIDEMPEPEKVAKKPYLEDRYINLLMEMLPHLSRQQQEVVDMRYFQKMRVIDIAKKLGIKQPSVSCQLLRVKHRLRDLIERAIRKRKLKDI